MNPEPTSPLTTPPSPLDTLPGTMPQMAWHPGAGVSFGGGERQSDGPSRKIKINKRDL